MVKGVPTGGKAGRSADRKHASKPRSGIYLLEPRMMYDGAAAATAHHVLQHHHAAHQDVGHIAGAQNAHLPPAAGNIGVAANGAAAHPEHEHGNRALTGNSQNAPTVGNAASGKGAAGAGSIHYDHTHDHDHPIADVTHHANTQSDLTTNVRGQSNAGTQHGQQVVFVDSTIADYQAIVAAINPGVKVFVYDGTQDGLAQIAKDLQGLHNLESIDIISHGDPGQMQIGTDTLSTSTISTYGADLAAIGKALSPHGQLDLYGCDVAAGGDGFIDALQQATGRNVAASTSPIGATDLGGTWTLDASTGPKPDALPADLTKIQSFDGVLFGGPVVNASGTVTFNGGGAPVVLDSGLSVSDSTSANLASATVEISSGFQSGDLLNFNNQHNITGSYNAMTGVLTLSGTDTLAHYQAALDSITYSFNPSNGDPTNGGGHTSRTISWTANDGSKSASDTSGLNVVHVAPAVTAGASAAYDTNSGGVPVVLDSSLTVSDPDSGGMLTGATVAIGPGAKSSDVLAFNNGTNTQTFADGDTISATYSNGTLTFTGNATVADYQAALESVTFSTTSSASNTRTIDWNVTDGSTSHGTSNTATSTVSMVSGAGINAGASVTYVSGGSPVVLDSGLNVSDPSATKLTGATVSISTGDLSGDTLTINGATSGTINDGIHGSIHYSFSGNTLTLTGNDTVSDYQTVLSEVAFNSSSSDPTSGGTDASRTISWTVNDGATSASDTSSVTVQHVAPTVTAGANATFALAAGTAVVLDQALTVTDPDSSGQLSAATVSIANFSVGDKLNFSNTASITGAYNAATGVLTLSGADTVADYQAALESITFSTTSATTGTRTIDWTATDGNSSNGTSAVATSTVHVAAGPSLSVGNPNVTFTGGGSPVVIDSGVTVSDDASGTLASATISITGGYISGDTLGFTNNAATMGNISGSYSNGQLVLTSQGGSATLAQWDAALRSVTYTAGNADPTGGGFDTSRTLTWSINDGTFTSHSATTSLATVHVAPVVNAGGSATYDGGGSPVALEPNLTIVDNNSGGNLTGAQVIFVGARSGDMLTINGATSGTLDNGKISFSYANGTMSLSGADSVAAYQAALRAVSYGFNPVSGDATNGGTATSRSFYWVVTDGNAVSGSNAFINNNQQPINNDQPTLGLNQLVILEGVYPSRDSFNGGADPGGIPMGAIRTFAGNFAWGGTATADGQILSIQQWTALFSLLGTTYGGDGIRNFGLPDLAGTLTTGADNNFNPLGAQTGVDGIYIRQQNLPPSAGSDVPLQNDQPSQAITYVINTGGTGAGGSDDYAGMIVPYLGNFAPTGYIVAAGQTLNINAYPTLFAAIGTTYGGDGVTTFKLPDLVDATAIGAGTSFHTGQTVAEGTTTGSDTNTLTIHNLPTGGDLPLNNYQPSVAVNYIINVSDGIYPSQDGGGAASSEAYLGEVIAYAGTTIPRGWMLAEGQTLSIAQNQALFSLIGTTYGGDGVRTFQLPDLVGRSVAGVGFNGATDTTTTLGEAYGTPQYQLTGADIPSSIPAGAISTLTIVHEPPVVTADGTVTYSVGNSAVTLDSTATVSDPDSGGILTSATVKIANGYVAGDVLSFNNGATSETFSDGATISETYSNGTLTLTGNASVADYQAALDSVSFSTTAGAQGSRTIDWTATDGNPNNGTSAIATSSVEVTALPIVGGTGNTVTFVQGQGPIVIDSAITVSDPAGAAVDSATATISQGFVSGDTFIYAGNTFQNQTVRVIMADGSAIDLSQSGNVLTLTTAVGHATAADYQLVLESINYGFAGDPTNGGTDHSRTVTWSVTDANSQTSASGATSTIDVFMTPVLASNITTPAVLTSPGNTVDVDSPLTVTDFNILGAAPVATVTISSGLQAGDELLPTAFPNGINFTYNGGTGVLTITGNAGTTAAEFQAALDAVTFSTTAANGARTLTWSFNDDAGGHTNTSNSVTTTVDVEFLPVIGSTGNTVIFQQGQGPIVLDSGITVSDPNTDIASATVTISQGFVSGDTFIYAGNTFQNQTVRVIMADGSAIDLSQSDNVLTLTTAAGHATAADYQLVLESINYGFAGDPTNGGTDHSRTVTWSVTDANSQTSAAGATSTIDVFGQPVIGSTGNTVTFNQGQASPTVVDSAITVSDPNSAAITSATATISSGFLPGDTLTFDNGSTSEHFQDGATITASQNGGVLTLTTTLGTASAADYQAALESVAYSFNGDPTNDGADNIRTLTWSVTDADNLKSVSGATSTIDVTHTPPVVTVGNPNVTFTGGGSPVTLDSGITVSDTVGGGDLSGATVTISSGLQSNDALSFNNSTDRERFRSGDVITASYNAASGVLTLSGNATVAEYQTALRQVQFSFNGNGDPAVGGTDTSRSITWQVSDAASQSSTANATTALKVVHGAPTVDAGNPFVTYDGGDPATVVDPGVTITDRDSGGTLTGGTVQITSGLLPNDVLSFNNGTNTETFRDGDTITATYDGATGTLTFTGVASVSDYQRAFRQVEFLSTGTVDPTDGGGDRSRMLSWQVTDGSPNNGSSNVDTSRLRVEHTPPSVDVGGFLPTVDYAGGDPPIVLDPNITVADPDSSGNLTGAAVTIALGELPSDVLSFNNGTNTETFNDGNTITATYDSATGTLTLKGIASIADYQQALQQVEYSSTGNADPMAGGFDFGRLVAWQVTDGSKSNGTSDPGFTGVVIEHTRPVATPSGVVEDYTTGGPPVAIDPSITVSDVDSGGNLYSATARITNGFQSGDVLSFNNGATSETFSDGSTITATYDSATGKLSLQGKASLADYQLALEQVQYSSTGDPTAGGSDLTRTIAWNVHDDSFVHGRSHTVTSTLDVSHVAPTVTAGNTVTYTPNGAAVVLDPGITVSDPDSGGNLNGATVSIGTGFQAGDTLTINGLTNGTLDNGKITFSYANGVLTLKGTDTVSAYQAALETITFSSSNSEPTANDTDTVRTINWTVSDGWETHGTSATATSTVDISHVAPTVTTSGNTPVFTAGGTTVALDPAVTVSDPDSGGNLNGATVSIGTGFQAGDLLNFTNQNNIVGNYNQATGVLTLIGTDTLAHYQAALESITFSSSNSDPTAGGADTTRTINWTVSDAWQSNNTSTAATSTVHTQTAPVVNTALQTLAPPPNNAPPTFTPAAFTQETVFGSSSAMFTNVEGNGANTFTFANFVTPGANISTAHADLSVIMTADGGIDFSLPTGAIEAALGGDIVGMRLTTPSGQPLPPWLQFNVADAKFAGQVPDQIATGSLGPDGGFGAPGNGHDTGTAGPGNSDHSKPDITGAAVLPTITIKVVATDAKGDLVIFYVNVKLNSAQPAPQKHGELSLPSSHVRMADFDRPSFEVAGHAVGHAPGSDMSHAAAERLAAHGGRAGLSAQLDGQGMRGMHAQRTALLASFQRVATSGR